jgi:hypothetical protein
MRIIKSLLIISVIFLLLAGCSKAKPADVQKSDSEEVKSTIKNESEIKVEEVLTEEPEDKNAVAENLVVGPLPVYADIQNHWGKANIDYLIEKGGVNGYPDGTFQPDGTITNAEFLKIAYLSATGETMPEAKAGEHWATALFSEAEKKGIVTSGEMPSTALSILITRYQMARIMIRLTENVLKEEATNTTGIENLMSDYKTVSTKTYYNYYVEQAYMKGLITGMDDIGTFAGSKTGTRAEACTMIARLLDKTKRVMVNE